MNLYSKAQLIPFVEFRTRGMQGESIMCISSFVIRKHCIWFEVLPEMCWPWPVSVASVWAVLPKALVVIPRKALCRSSFLLTLQTLMASHAELQWFR